MFGICLVGAPGSRAHPFNTPSIAQHISERPTVLDSIARLITSDDTCSSTPSAICAVASGRRVARAQVPSHGITHLRGNLKARRRSEALGPERKAGRPAVALPPVAAPGNCPDQLSTHPNPPLFAAVQPLVSLLPASRQLIFQHYFTRPTRQRLHILSGLLLPGFEVLKAVEGRGVGLKKSSCAMRLAR